MKKIGIICKRNRPEPVEIMAALLPWLRQRGIEALIATDSPEDCKVPACRPEELKGRVDMAVVLGGDGTMLGAARTFASFGTPLLGINLGGLGFITEVPADEILRVFEEILAGDYLIEERMMLEACVDGECGSPATSIALNDIAVVKGTVARLIDLRTAVDGKFVNLFKGDGIIISSPTGSTAYSMSAGGPIIHPSLDCLLLTPICPHTLTNRPIVLTSDVCVQITLETGDDSAILTYDGIVAGNIGCGHTVTIRRSVHKARLIMPKTRDHFMVLRTKLKWGER